MSKQTEEKDELLVDVQHAYSKTELYIEENKKSLAIIAAGIILVVTGYFAWDKLYVAPQEEEAQSKMFVAQQYFENDSLDKAINGDGNNPGFKTIAEEYGVTKSANLAHYYLGICYLKKGKFEVKWVVREGVPLNTCLYNLFLFCSKAILHFDSFPKKLNTLE